MPSVAPAWTQALAPASVPVAAAMLGGVVGATSAGRHRRLTAVLVQFAAGAFAGLALFHLLPESAAGIGWLAAIAAAVAGFGACALLARWAGGFCPACDATHQHAAPVRLGLPLLIVVAIHSGLDGLPLADAVRHSNSMALVSLAILAHKVPEGLAVAALCRSAGRSVAAALALTAAVEACTFAGMAIGMELGVSGGPLLGLCLAAVAGSFLYLAAITFEFGREATSGIGAAVAGAGAILILVAQLFSR